MLMQGSLLFSSTLCWCSTTSLHTRTPIILEEGDLLPHTEIRLPELAERGHSLSGLGPEF